MRITEETNETDAVAAAAMLVREDIPTSVHDDALHFLPSGDQHGREAQVRAQNAALRGYGIHTLAYFNSMIGETYTEVFAAGEARKCFATFEDKTYLFTYKGAGSTPFFVGLVDFSAPNCSE